VRLTPPGRGAIATVLVEGPGALELVTAECRSASPGFLVTDDRLRLVRLGPEPAEAVVVHVADAERIELHCHGGAAVVDRMVELFSARGAVPLDWPTWLGTHAGDPVAADACRALAQAPTMRTAAILVDQCQGALQRALQTVTADLAAGRKASAHAALDTLVRRAAMGRHLVRPWRVVLAGPPNAGKSTLTNALLGYARAIVHPTPGTTRDLLTATTAIDGWPVELVDTAGLHDSAHPLEQAGIAVAERELAVADLVVLVFDQSQMRAAADTDLIDRYPAALVVWNKADLAGGKWSGAGLSISALSGQGVEQLTAALARRLVPEPPPPGAAVPFTDAQIAHLEGLLRECRMPSSE
jgi:tRNA modification GTPase